jgi:hypothetical protein
LSRGEVEKPTGDEVPEYPGMEQEDFDDSIPF